MATKRLVDQGSHFEMRHEIGCEDWFAGGIDVSIGNKILQGIFTI